jgi:hypothetical protein
VIEDDIKEVPGTNSKRPNGSQCVVWLSSKWPEKQLAAAGAKPEL